MYLVRPACFDFLYNVYPKILKNWAKYHKSAYVFKASAFFFSPQNPPTIKFYKNPYGERISMQMDRRDEANIH